MYFYNLIKSFKGDRKMNNCKNCYYQQLSFLGRICQHKPSMEGTEAIAEYVYCNEINLCEYYSCYKEIEDTYRIIKITDKEGNDKSDGRYPIRIGRLCKKPLKDDLDRLFIYYLENADGSDYSGKVLRTSRIENISEIEDQMIVETINSIYYFKKECHKQYNWE